VFPAASGPRLFAHRPRPADGRRSNPDAGGERAMNLDTPLLANFVFEPYVSLFSVATVIGGVVGMAFGLVAGFRKDSLWLKAIFFAVALALASLLAVPAEIVFGHAASVATVLQSTVGFLFGWGMSAMIWTYFRIFERSGRS